MPSVENNRNGNIGVAINPSFEWYCRDFSAQLCRAFPQKHITWSQFENRMPLVTVEETDHVLMPAIINGDSWEKMFTETALSGSAYTESPDIAGPNCNRLSIIMPFGDFRQDQRTRKSYPDNADPSQQAIVKKQIVFTRTLAKMLKFVAGADDVTVDEFHSYFSYKTFLDIGLNPTNISTMRLFADYLVRMPDMDGINKNNTIIGTTDFGDLNRAVPLSHILDLNIAVVQKWRIAKESGTSSDVFHKLIYGDPKDKMVILIDDMISGASSLKDAVNLYDSMEASSYIIFVPHAILVGDYYEKMQNILENPKVKAVIITNSIPLNTRFSGVVAKPYIGIGQNKREVQVLNVNPLNLKVAKAILSTPTITKAREKLGDNVWNMEDPYELACGLVGIELPKPRDTGIYLGNGIFLPLEQATPRQHVIFSSST